MAITPRDLDIDFANVPRHWHAGNVIATDISNGVNMLFPHGERPASDYVDALKAIFHLVR